MRASWGVVAVVAMLLGATAHGFACIAPRCTSTPVLAHGGGDVGGGSSGGGGFWGRRRDNNNNNDDDESRRRDHMWVAVALGLVPQAAQALPKGRRDLKDFSPRERLASIPCFYVANARGSPYLLNREKEAVQECVIFMDPTDAETLLNEMSQASPQVSDARVFCVGLDRALAMAQRKPSPSGNVDRNGRELYLRYRIQPADNQVAAAKKKVGKPRGATILPCFLSPQLEVTRGGIKTTPIFLAIEDLRETWQLLNDAKPESKKKKPEGGLPGISPGATTKNAEPEKVICYNLIDIVLASEQPDMPPGDWDRMIFVPMPRAVEYVREARRRGNLNSRLHARLAAD